jgi:putative tryptophan/tyrosine transport system substrate-binding protein
LRLGLLPALTDPGGNLTGTTIMTLEMASKRLDLVRQLVPNATAIGMLVNPKFPTASAEAREVQDAARSRGIQSNLLNASTGNEIDAAFTTIVEQRNGALIVGTDPFLLGQRDQLVQLAARHMIPTIYFLREFVEAGGLMSYGPNIANGYRQAGVYVGLILNGADPAVLPIVRPTQFLFYLNLKTAKTLGLQIPPLLLALADEVIE